MMLLSCVLQIVRRLCAVFESSDVFMLSVAYLLAEKIAFFCSNDLINRVYDKTDRDLLLLTVIAEIGSVVCLILL